MPETVEFQHLRDGGYPAAIRAGASETVAEILAGYKIKGMSDAYVKRDPTMVKAATDAIEKHYFSKAEKVKNAKRAPQV